MKRIDMVREIKKRHPLLHRATVNGVLGSVFSVILESLVKKNNVTIYNFGEFYVKRSKVTHVYDFKSKVTIPFNGKYNIKFRACPKAKKEVNG